MDLRKLAIFREVARHSSVRKAADNLHIAQPAVSIAIRKLEQELNTKLFNRVGRGISITKEGEEVLARCQTILDQVQDLKDSVQQRNQLLRGELTLSSPAMLATYFLPPLLSGFLETYPGISASISQTGTREIRRQLLSRDIELGVVTLEDANDDDVFELVPLAREQLVICAHKDAAIASKREIHIRDLDNTPMVVYEQGYNVRTSLDQLCQQYHSRPEIRLQTNFLPLLIRGVHQGIGVTVALQQMTDQEPDLVAIPLKPPVELQLALAKRRDHSISRANQAFFDWCAEDDSRVTKN